MKKLSLRPKVYLIIIYIITALSFIFSIETSYIPIHIDSTIIEKVAFFSILTAITESFTLNFKRLSFSTTFSVTIASYFLCGPLVCIIIVIIGFTLRILKLENGFYEHVFNTPIYITFFNYCILIFPIIIGNYFYIICGGRFETDSVVSNTLQLWLVGCIYFLINTILISIIQGMMSGKHIVYCFANNVKLMLLNILAMIPLGAILAQIFLTYSYIGVVISIFPIVLVRYTFSLYVDSKNQYIQTVDVLMNSIEARDKYTEGHSKRVAEISMQIARELKYNEWKLEQLNMAAMLHDVGKIGVSDTILNKPGKLTEEEYEAIKEHPAIGYKILKEVKNLEVVSKIVKHHHERYDGKGYPEGKNGDELPLDVFIIQLADSVDAMTTDRPYRRALSKDEIITEIEENIGTQFHPQIAEVYLDIIKQ